jgi:hypothetical protein
LSFRRPLAEESAFRFVPKNAAEPLLHRNTQGVVIPKALAEESAFSCL